MFGEQSCQLNAQLAESPLLGKASVAMASSNSNAPAQIFISALS